MMCIVTYVQGEPARFDKLSDEEIVGKGGIRRADEGIEKLRFGRARS